MGEPSCETEGCDRPFHTGSVAVVFRSAEGESAVLTFCSMACAATTTVDSYFGPETQTELVDFALDHGFTL